MFTTSFAAPDRFLSTLPARGATDDGKNNINANLFLSTLPARGATTRLSACKAKVQNFYPRSPRGERHLDMLQHIGLTDFYPRSPRGERRMDIAPGRILIVISIHAPREGSDLHLQKSG